MSLESYSTDELLLKRRGIRRQLAAEEGLKPLRIAVLGGSTTNEVVDFLELYLLDSGFAPVFHQSEYGRFYEDAVLDPAELITFAPDLVYVHTSCLNVQGLPAVHNSAAEVEAALDAETCRYQQIWQAIKANTSAQIIQNNFELPPQAILGNLDAVVPGGATRFLLALNDRFARAAESDPRLLLQDVHGLSARLGLQQWFDWDRYFSYKILTTPEASLVMARSLASMVRALYGKARKVLVLDLDNTLWGGVIGDDGVDGLALGQNSAVGEAHVALQRFLLDLRRRGIILAVCSKNEDATARIPFREHPEMVLKEDHIAVFTANWSDKANNIREIAATLNIGTDSLVFLDDNPVERAQVRQVLPEVAVPELTEDPADYIGLLANAGYFEAVALSEEDLARADFYQANAERVSLQKVGNIGEYLLSLKMVATISPFNSVGRVRIAQLINKSNQFNLTTRRYSEAEVEAIEKDPAKYSLQVRLADRFGDNGMISVIVFDIGPEEWTCDTWLMSCRVLGRRVEELVLATVAEAAKKAGAKRLVGVYLPTKKNALVVEHFAKLGFTKTADLPDGETHWVLDIERYSAPELPMEVVYAEDLSPAMASV